MKSINQTVPSPVAPAITLSANQERVWFLQNLSTSEQPFIVSSVLAVDGRVDSRQLENGVDQLLADYPILRVVVAGVGGSPQARIAPVDAEDVLHSETLPDADALSRRERALTQEPFDLETGPLFKVFHLHTVSGESRILLIAHQIILDGHGLGLLTNALAMYIHDSGEPATYTDVTTITLPEQDHTPWWQTRLETVKPLEFPIDKARLPVQNYERSAVEIDLSDNLAARVAVFAESEKCAIETVLLTTFTTLLYRYTMTDDLIFALDIRRQTIDNAHSVVGPLDNLVPLRVPLNQGMTFAELLEQMPAIRDESLAHEIPFAKLLQAISVDRDLSRAPLVQTAFSWSGDISTWAAGLPMVLAELLDLHIVAYQQDGNIRLRLKYDPTVFERGTIARIAEHFTVLLSSAISQPEQMLIKLRLMSDRERETVLVKWNETAVAFPHDQCVHHLIEAQVERAPDRIAAVSGDEEITYRALNERANQLAHYIQSLGVQPDDLVGVHLERSIDMLAAVLAIMKAGGGYVPLDPNFPQDRLNLIVEDSRIKVLITHSTMQAHAPKHEAETIIIDQINFSDFSSDNPTSAVQPTDLIYVIFTSGSTGRPKGVQLEHRTVVNFLTSMQTEPGLAEDDILLAVTTLSFDIAALELYLPLITGARVVIASYEDVLDGRRVLELMERHSVTVLQATPATWQLMLAADWQESPGLTALCGGEALPLELAQKIRARCKALWNMYGPTETTVWSSVEPIQKVTDFISIGHPINNTTIYILDAADNPAPIGVPGELTIGGDGVARSYFGRPDLTAEKFIPDPFLSQTSLAQTSPNADNPRMYRTGDVARYLADGRLQFYGRVDHQVKVRGFRIELGEIEAILGQHADVRQNVVIVREDTPDDKQIVAYLIMHEGKTLNQTELRGYLKEHLPNYMIPAVFVTLDTFPLTPNGKVNRRALPKVDLSDNLVSDREYVAPRNDVETRVARIWSEVLNIPKLSVHDDFFGLGGHSILAIRIFTQIEKEFGQSLPLISLFRAPTVSQFAALLGDDVPVLDDHTYHPAVVPIKPQGSKPPVFCVGGGMINMNNLARRLDDDQPFYGLQWEGLGGDHIMDVTLQEAASQFVAAMRSAQPHGPYYLSGSFAAGLITVEMARQLSQQGEEIAILAGFDTVVRDDEYLVRSESSDTPGQPYKKRSPINKAWRLLRRGPGAVWQAVIDSTILEKLQHAVWKVAIKILTPFNRPIPLWLRSGLFVEFFIWRVNEQYVPEHTYDGDFQIYLTPDYYNKYSKMPKYGWSGFVSGQVEAHPTPGDPCTIMIDPNVEVLARQFQEHLAQTNSMNG